MPRARIDWHRVFIVYLGVAGACLAAACFTSGSIHRFYFFAGMSLVVGFVPLVMGMYFLQGLRGTQ